MRASIDGFHHPRAYRYRQGESSAVGCYADTFDHLALRRHLLDPFGPGGSGLHRTCVFDAGADRPVEQPARQAPADVVLLVDGVCLQRPELVGCWDLVVLLEVPDDELLRRAAVRDTQLFGTAEQVQHRYRTRYLPAQRLYEQEARPVEHADVVLDNTHPAVPLVLCWPV